MGRRLERWRALSGGDQARLLACVAGVWAIHLGLAVAGYARMRRGVERGSRHRQPRKATQDELTQARTLARLAAIAGRYALGDATCLRRSLLLYGWLRRRGLQPVLQLGVAATAAPGQAFQAHAWVELDGELLSPADAGHRPFTANASTTIEDNAMPAPAQIQLHVHPPRAQAPLAEPVAHAWTRVDGSPWIDRHDTAAGTVLRLPGQADFHIDASGTRVEAWPLPQLDPATCQLLFLNNVMPMALSRQGRLVLHASAVEIDGAALVFVGLSGRGKSTLATSFALLGHALVVDDGLLLEPSAGGWMARPGEAAVRLRSDSQAWLDARLGDHAPATTAVHYTDKTRVAAGPALRFSQSPLPVRAVFVLGDDPDATLQLQPLPPAQALIQLVHYSFLLDVGDRARHRLQLRHTAALAAACPVLRLDYPRRYDDLARVQQAILACAGGAAPTGSGQATAPSTSASATPPHPP